MRARTRRLFSVAVLIFIASVVGLALIFEWPTQLDGSGNPNITAEELVANGTATSLPLYPWIALAAFALFARSRRASKAGTPTRWLCRFAVAWPGVFLCRAPRPGFACKRRADGDFCEGYERVSLR